MTFTHTGIGVVAGLLAVATVVAQAPQENLPTFRGGVQLIDVDVVVTDRDGKAVRDLTPDDFEIAEDGRAQRIRTFSLIDLPLPPLQVRKEGVAEVEPDVVTNTGPEGRTYVLLIDATTGQLRARHVAERWLDEVVRPNDRVAVVHMYGTFTRGQGFTSSRRLILDSIDKVIHQTDDDATVVSFNSDAGNRFLLIKDLAERLGTIAGRRKAIVWLGASVNLFPRFQRDTLASQTYFGADAWRDAARAAANNNVAIYPVDHEGLTTELGAHVVARQASYREVAEETGGIPVVNTNNFSDAFATIAQDAGVYYLLGYTPEPERTDGKFHPIRVRVKRPGVTVRARRGYYAPSLDAPPPRPLPMPPQGVSLSARDALRRPVGVPGLGIDVATSSFKGMGDDVAVVITAHIRPQMLSFEHGRQVAVSYQVFDLEGKVATGAYKVFGMKLEPETRARVEKDGFQFVERVTLKPGRYELRLVADQPGGALGSVVAHIDAREFDDDLSLSSVALAPRPSGEVVLTGDASIRDVLKVDPSARRAFRAADGLAVYAEVYTKLDRATKQSRNEDDATLTATITAGTQRAIVSAPGQRAVAERVGGMLREGFRLEPGIAALAPGQYVLTLEARSKRDPNRAPVTRQIPFEIVQ